MLFSTGVDTRYIEPLQRGCPTTDYTLTQRPSNDNSIRQLSVALRLRVKIQNPGHPAFGALIFDERRDACSGTGEAIRADSTSGAESK